MSGLIPIIGKYYINSIYYDINSFLLNQKNKIFRVKIQEPGKKFEDFTERFLIVTDTVFFIFNSLNYQNKKNLCVINYVGDIFAVKDMKRYIENDIDLNDYFCVKFEWEFYAQNYLKNVLCFKGNSLDAKEVCNCILGKRDKLKKNFNLFEKYGSHSVEEYAKIIEIKEKLVESKPDDLINKTVTDLYQRIIELFTKMNDDGHQKYLKKLHEFISKQDKLTQEKTISENK